MAFGEAERELTVALIEGALETPPWTTFLDGLRRATGADYAVLNFRPPGRPFAEAVNLLSGDAPSRIDEASREFFPRDPVVNERMIEGRPYTLDKVLGSSLGPEAQLFRDLLSRDDVTAVRQMRVQEESGVHAWLTIARRGDDFGPCDETLLSSLARALRGVLRQYVALERERFEASMTADAVRRLQFGWLTLDRGGRVLNCDTEGERLLSQSGVLSRTREGRLAARPAELEREILQVLNRLAENPNGRPHAIRLCQDPWLDMLLVPTGRKSISAKASPVAIAYVHGDSWSSADRRDQLAELFRLLPREARLALALCRGMTIAEAAVEFGLTIETARNYSKSIYAKTGARGLPDLVRIVMRSVLAVAPEA